MKPSFASSFPAIEHLDQFQIKSSRAILRAEPHFFMVFNCLSTVGNFTECAQLQFIKTFRAQAKGLSFVKTS